MDNNIKEIEKILKGFVVFKTITTYKGEEHYEREKDLVEALSSYIKEREREAYNYGVVVGGGVESDEIWWVCDKGGHKVQLKDNVQNILSDEVKARCPICNGILYKTKPHETPKDRFEKEFGKVEEFNVMLGVEPAWNYHTTELKAVLDSLRMEEKTEADGWEHFFDNCCPGDNVADGWNYAAKEINQKIDKILKEYE